MMLSGQCSLIVRGNTLDFNEITNRTNLKSTKITKCGEIISKILAPSEEDAWIYQIEFSQVNELNPKLNELLSRLEPCKDYLYILGKKADVCLRCYLQSDLAQISFEFSPDVISKLANLGVRMEHPIFSWGGVAD